MPECVKIEPRGNLTCGFRPDTPYLLQILRASEDGLPPCLGLDPSAMSDDGRGPCEPYARQADQAGHRGNVRIEATGQAYLGTGATPGSRRDNADGKHQAESYAHDKTS